MMNIWRNIVGFLDRTIYWFVEILFQIIMDLSNAEIFSQSVINDFARRIYIILGLIMVFKIMISFIQILINPEKMSDKEQGVGNILIRVVKALLLIVFVPMIFKTARLAQNYVIPVIPKVILGVTINPSTDGEASETMASVGRMMAFYSFLPFFNYDNTSCDDGSIYGTGTQLGAQTTVPEIYSVGTAIDHVNDKDCNTTTSKDGYKYNYRWLVSTFVGAYLVYVLVSIAVSIAIRTLKFAICEFAAPIPIASYVDPKTSKQTFDTWVSTTWKVYLDLFIRIIIVYFIIFVFDTIFQPENLSIIYAKLNNDWWRCTLVTLFLIVGLLQFAKSAPKFIGDMLGLKGSGDFMGMFKGEGWKALAPFTKGNYDIARSNATSQYERLRSQGKSKKEAIFGAARSAVAGVGSSTARALVATAQGKTGKDLRQASFGAAVARRNERNFNRDNNYTWSQRHRDKVRKNLEIPSSNEYLAGRPTQYSNMYKSVKDFIEYGNKKKEERPDSVFGLRGYGVDASGNVVSQDYTLGALREMQKREEGKIYVNPFTGNREEWTASHGSQIAQAISDAEKKGKYAVADDLLNPRDPRTGNVRLDKVDNTASTYADNIRFDFKQNKTVFNDTLEVNGVKQNAGEIFLNAFRKKTGMSFASIDDFETYMQNNEHINATFLEGFKEGYETLDNLANIAAREAEIKNKNSKSQQ